MRYVIRSVSENDLFWHNYGEGSPFAGWGSREGCAEYSVDERYTYRDRLPIDGEWIQAQGA